jgi:hypothetical protein
MLDGTEFYVVLKLTSGEQMMAVLRNEDEEYVEIEYPMVMRMIPIMSEGKEHITAHPFCQFSDDRNFTLHKSNIMFVKKLHHVFIPHYQRIVHEHEKTSLVTNNKGVSQETSLEWEDEMLTVEEAKKRIEMLRSIVGIEEKEQPSPSSTFVEGNDTIN